MTLNEEQLERIARHLDGENVVLSPEEESVATDIRRAEAELTDTMDATMPVAVRNRAERSLMTALRRPLRRVLRVAYAAGAAAIAAGIILVASLWLMREPTSSTPAGPTAAEVIAVYADVDTDSDDAKLLKEVDPQLQKQMTATAAVKTNTAIDAQFDTLEKSIEEFWQTDTTLSMVDTSS